MKTRQPFPFVGVDPNVQATDVPTETVPGLCCTTTGAAIYVTRPGRTGPNVLPS